MYKLVAGLLGIAVVTATACVDEGPETYDQQKLDEYRRALPSRAQLEASAPRATTAALLGDPALYPHASADVVLGINGTVKATIDMLQLIVNTPPTLYNSETKEFWWGPYPGDDFGYVGAYIKDAGDTADFRYQFAFVRGATNDLATLTPVVYGGSTPNRSVADQGVGIVMWDLTASRDFEQAYNPAFDPANFDQGRFVALFGKGPDETNPTDLVTWVVAVFRNFIPKDNPTAEPVDLDYLYGRYESAAHTIDFIDFEANFDVSEPKDGIAEDVGIRMAFLDEGTGRAEADAVDGSLAANQRMAVQECWDTSIDQTYIHGELMDGTTEQGSWQLGEPTNCGMFNATLDDLNIPSLQDIDPSLLAALDNLATNGAP